MENNNNHPKPIKEKNADIEKELTYPSSEDIYNQAEKVASVDPEDTGKLKETNREGEFEILNEKDFKDDVSGGDLDVPGSELDDEQEAVGSEDEENNYYSIGGDNHTDLEEEKIE